VTNDVVTSGTVDSTNPASTRLRAALTRFKKRFRQRLSAIGKLSNTTALKHTQVYHTVLALF
jgi:hypothetical protein